MAEAKLLSLYKGEHRFIFRYETGCEEEVLDAFVDMANERQNDFDWFDAAVLSFQLSKNLVDEADRLLCSQRPPEHHRASESETPWDPGEI